ncbi:hypothetical protein PX699_00160 [Sphingobium sp. H39-3-25]|uniref:hypothetical protein n=1 Tax=Sphingobium arseniciresistens TaxID=3030834 RepID=UPI0023B9E6B6|nr:hypothetical protein [Sphingobium arseniciresistens]
MKGFFDENGALICATETDMMPPEKTVFEAEFPAGASANDVYFKDGAVRLRTHMTLTISRNMIGGLPVGAIVVWSDGEAIIDDGDLEFDADVEQAMRVTVMHPAHHPTVVVVQTGP